MFFRRETASAMVATLVCREPGSTPDSHPASEGTAPSSTIDQKTFFGRLVAAPNRLPYTHNSPPRVTPSRSRLKLARSVRNTTSKQAGALNSVAGDSCNVEQIVHFEDDDGVGAAGRFTLGVDLKRFGKQYLKFLILRKIEKSCNRSSASIDYYRQ